MSVRTTVVAACCLAGCLSVPARCQCGPNMEKQIAEIMNTWVQRLERKTNGRLDDALLFSRRFVASGRE